MKKKCQVDCNNNIVVLCGTPRSELVKCSINSEVSMLTDETVSVVYIMLISERKLKKHR